MYDNYLYHFGVKGMKWGVRRYQNSDGTLTAAGRRKRANEYNYKQTDTYKNATRGQKATMTQTHNATKQMLGKKAANRIDYKVYEENADRNKLARREFAKQAVAGVAITVACTVGKDYVIGKFNQTKGYIDVNNLAVERMGYTNGLNEVKGGFTLGGKAISRGKQIVERMVKYR